MEQLADGRESICAVLLDVVMPVMDGMEVLREMNAQGWTEEIPVFLITAEAGSDVLREAYTLGVMDVISKPVVPYVVQRRIGSVIELFSARERLSSKVAEQQDEIFQQAQQIIELNMGMIEALSTAIEFRSGESGAHVRRIHDITRHMLLHTKLGGRGLSEETVTHISMAGGHARRGQDCDTRQYPEQAGEAYAGGVRDHEDPHPQGGRAAGENPPDAGSRRFPLRLRHSEIARRWDGRGYPDGLRGAEASVWSQIVAVADVYDALVSKRVYKDAFSVETALDMIVGGQCGVFSPELLESFLAVEKELRGLYRPGAGQIS